METIRTYIDNMFRALPKNEQVDRAKTDLLEMMEDKYNALKAEGKSENEAIGHVISEFGNINELTKELGIETDSTEKTSEKKSKNSVLLSDSESDEFFSARVKASCGIGFGVMLCILAPAAFIFLKALFRRGFGGWVFTDNFIKAVPLAVLLALIALGVFLLVLSGFKLSPYEKYDDKKILLSDSKFKEVEGNFKAYGKKFAISIASALLLIFAGVIIVVAVRGSDFIEKCSVSALLVLISIAVFMFIKSGMKQGTYQQLLYLNDENDDEEDDDDEDFDLSTKSGRIGEAITSALWTVTIISYFLWSFIGGDWNISWIVFPIAGVLSGTISTIAKAAGSDEKK